MHWRSLGLGLLLILSPISAAQAHEAHRNNEPDPVAQSIEPRVADDDMQSMQSEDMLDSRAEHVNNTAADKGFDLIDFLGRLHPMAVHFPIALFLVAALAELIMIINPAAGVGNSVRFLVWIGAIGGIVAAILGWLAGGIRWSDRSEILGLHRWTGTAIAITGILLAFLSSAPAGSGKRTIFRVGLAAVALAILFQGYWGAEMSLGPNHMGM